MHREPDIAEPQRLPLHEAAERLSCYLSNQTQFVLNEVLARGRVPVLAMRRDIVGPLPDQVEGLLARASSIRVVSHNNAILAEYQFASEQDVRQVLGPRSTLAYPEPRRFPLIINLDFDQVWVCWETLMRELRRVGWAPADETAATLRKLGLWPASWGPISAGPANEAPHAVAAGAPNRAAPEKRKPRRDEKRPEIVQALASLAGLEVWGESSDKERCELVEQHLQKSSGWCKVTTLRRAIAGRDSVLPQSTTSPL